mgnify:CR=1 FL=1
MDDLSWLKEDHDYYFSPRPYLMDLVSRHSLSEVRIDGEWKVYTEMIQKGKEPVTDKEGMVHLGSAKVTETRKVELTYDKTVQLIEKWKKDYPHLAPKPK